MSILRRGLTASPDSPPFDVATRTPLIVRMPGRTAYGSAAGLVEFVDIYPTIVELLDLPDPDHLQGSSFVAQLKDPGAPGKAAVFPRWHSGVELAVGEAARETEVNPTVSAKYLPRSLPAMGSKKLCPQVKNRTFRNQNVSVREHHRQKMKCNLLATNFLHCFVHLADNGNDPWSDDVVQEKNISHRDLLHYFLLLIDARSSQGVAAATRSFFDVGSITARS